ncbi:MAG: DUF441 domain-containing protein [Alicyclobacillus sp.]|nr:DUF441 domain-containing protein [Alicyclobacillus sp.]
MTPEILLILLITVGVVGRAALISVAASLLLTLRMLHLDRFFPLLERRSLELGLLFLMISILVPLASGRVDAREMLRTVISPLGLLTVCAGIFATVINSEGLELLQEFPTLLISVVVGSVIGIALFGGIPIGPLMATALAALFYNLWRWFQT